MPALAHRWTRAEVLALPADGNKYELIDGELLVSPSARPLHQRAVMELYRLVDPFVRKHRLGWTVCLAADLSFRGEQLLQPDLFVTALQKGLVPKRWEDCEIPMLTVEVLSPSTSQNDRGTKRRFYQRTGVADYWIVDVDARSVEVWHPASERGQRETTVLTWAPAGAETLTIDLSQYFRAVWGDER